MTRDEVLAMEPGRELDALVAEKVMGWTHFREKWNGIVPEEIPHYSTDISAAWEAAEKNGKNAFEVGRSGERFLQKWTARFGMMNDWAEADTAPLAICRAALLAVMEA